MKFSTPRLDSILKSDGSMPEFMKAIQEAEHMAARDERRKVLKEVLALCACFLGVTDNAKHIADCIRAKYPEDCDA